MPIEMWWPLTMLMGGTTVRICTRTAEVQYTTTTTIITVELVIDKTEKEIIQKPSMRACPSFAMQVTTKEP